MNVRIMKSVNTYYEENNYSYNHTLFSLWSPLLSFLKEMNFLQFLGDRWGEGKDIHFKKLHKQLPKKQPNNGIFNFQNRYKKGTLGKKKLGENREKHACKEKKIIEKNISDLWLAASGEDGPVGGVSPDNGGYPPG